jgi:hypothetical protein
MLKLLTRNNNSSDAVPDPEAITELHGVCEAIADMNANRRMNADIWQIHYRRAMQGILNYRNGVRQQVEERIFQDVRD